MTAMDRTAYPRLGERLTREELRARYNLADADLTFIRANARGDVGRLTLAMVLKTRKILDAFQRCVMFTPTPWPILPCKSR